MSTKIPNPIALRMPIMLAFAEGDYRALPNYRAQELCSSPSGHLRPTTREQTPRGFRFASKNQRIIVLSTPGVSIENVAFCSWCAII
jgi:hypothetical protein